MDREKLSGRWVSVIHRYAHIYFATELEELGISKGAFPFLMALYRKDSVSQEELSEMLHMDKGTTARALNPLEKNGWVKRKQNPKNRRINIVSLTEKAVGMEDEVFSYALKWNEIIFDGINREDQEKVSKTLKKMAGNAAKYIKER